MKLDAHITDMQSGKQMPLDDADREIVGELTIAVKKIRARYGREMFNAAMAFDTLRRMGAALPKEMMDSFSDSLRESVKPAAELFGEKRLLALLNELKTTTDAAVRALEAKRRGTK